MLNNSVSPIDSLTPIISVSIFLKALITDLDILPGHGGQSRINCRYPSAWVRAIPIDAASYQVILAQGMAYERMALIFSREWNISKSIRRTKGENA
jgi:hypothetical protein